MFNVNTSKKQPPRKKPVPILTGKNIIELKGDFSDVAKVRPTAGTNSTVQAVSVTNTDSECSSNIMFEIY
jgi:hypothetical protein